MFGNKDEVRERLEQRVALVTQSQGITQAALARGVNRSTINRMLADLYEMGVPIYEERRRATRSLN